MAEIKSTIDIVMEKTKNLNLSDAEKQDQKSKEMVSRLNGFLQKFEDQHISVEQFKAEYQTLCKEYNLAGTQTALLLEVLCDRIALGKDNQTLLDLLSQFAESSIEGITAVLQDFETAIQTAAAAQTQIAKDALTSDHFISGSAVVPNLESDEAWRAEAEQIHARHQQMLEEEKTRLTGKS